MRGRRSRLEVWIPGGYLAVVVGLLVWVDVLVRTGDAGFAGVWPILASAPVSLLAAGLFLPGPGKALEEPETEPPYTGPEPPPVGPGPDGAVPLPVGPPPSPGEWSAGADLPPVGEQADLWLGFGFYGAVLAGALVNAALLWLLVRGVVSLRSR
ncbi:hypothetical protein OOK31_35170 [Streptomyces sp. NBC_00249]|uniref:SCO4225 family membrane protein n=1 Tax=Streptomyces sp. NBC_00249 TaxID=2975690 RepID=UPI002252B476|nr:hypothetical protein [Streptomyces sp. NBC_00249]MCX5199069.1 hypothetical protein [Streptomyces sp. NBC_00249]